MDEKRQISILIAFSLICCAVIICFGLFYNSSTNIYDVKVEVVESKVISENSKGSGNASSKLSSSLLTEEKLDLNVATFFELTSLPGIGEVTADAIIAYREENGKFNTVEEIMAVDGIGEKKFENLLPYIVVE